MPACGCVSLNNNPSNAGLPEEISPRFQDFFIPTLLAYCGTVPNPWDLPQPLHVIIADLWPVVFPQTPYQERSYGVGTPTYNIVSDSWIILVYCLN